MEDKLDGSADAIRKAAFPPDGHVYDECGPFTNNPKEREYLLKTFLETKPRTNINTIGTIVMYGTGGDIEECNFKDLFITKCRAKHHNYISFPMQPNINYKTMEHPKFKLIIKKDSLGKLYATTIAMNGRYVWRTTESYERLQGLKKALHYLKKPDSVEIHINNISHKRKLNIEYNILSIWESI